MTPFLASLRVVAGTGWRSADDIAQQLGVERARVVNGLRLLATRRYGGHQLDVRLNHNLAEYRLWPARAAAVDGGAGCMCGGRGQRVADDDGHPNARWRCQRCGEIWYTSADSLAHSYRRITSRESPAERSTEG